MAKSRSQKPEARNRKPETGHKDTEAQGAVADPAGAEASAAGGLSSPPGTTTTSAPARVPDSFSSPSGTVTHVRVTAKREGFRRARIAHSRTPALHRLEDLTNAQLDALLAETELTVEEVSIPLD